MKYKKIFVILVFLMLGIFISAMVPAGYTLVWNDEFDGTTLDTTKWLNPTTDNSCSGTQSTFTQANAYLDGHGHLVLRAQQETAGGCPYTSGQISTYQKFSQAYGRFEFSAQMPEGGQGIWPGLWMYPKGISWPPEIDVLEMINNMNTAYLTYHWPPGNNYNQSSYQDNALTTGYHVYAVEWKPGEIRWYIDGVLRKTHSGSDVTSTPMSILLSFYLGGIWSGAVSDSTVFPQYMYVDYVRVYAKESILQHLLHLFLPLSLSRRNTNFRQFNNNGYKWNNRGNCYNYCNYLSLTDDKSFLSTILE